MKFKLKVIVATTALILLSAIAFNQAEAREHQKKEPAGHAGDWICLAPFFSTKKWCHGKAGR